MHHGEGPSGLMDKALVSGAKDCGFESHLGWPACAFVFVFYFAHFTNKALTFFPKAGGIGSWQTTSARAMIDSCSLGVEHRSYEPGVAGSIPARSSAPVV